MLWGIFTLVNARSGLITRISMLFHKHWLFLMSESILVDILTKVLSPKTCVVLAAYYHMQGSPNYTA